MPYVRGISEIKNRCLLFLRACRFSKIIADIRPKYILKCIILSRFGIFIKETLLKVSELAKLRYIIIKAKIIDNIFFFSISVIWGKFK